MKRVIVSVTLLVLVVGIVGMGYYTFRNDKDRTEEAQVTTEVQEVSQPEDEPKDEPKESVDEPVEKDVAMVDPNKGTMEEIELYFHQFIHKFKPYKDGRWCYEDGIILLGASYLSDATGSPYYDEFVADYLWRHIDEEGQLKQYKMDDYNIDNINAGKVLFDYSDQDNYRIALNTLYEQVLNQPRTESGNFWHKNKYPNQVWLDGLYMAQPFYARYVIEVEASNDFSDILNQFTNVRKNLWDEDQKLYRHAFDESYKMSWADPETGLSKNVWNRSVGWYAMALVDVMEICEDYPEVKEVLEPMLVELVDGMLPHQEEQGMWYQIVDGPEIEGNYLETSGTLMMAYSILKAVRLGYLPESYQDYGLNAFRGTMDTYFYKENAQLHLGGTCRSAGLDGDKRDGSVAYYLSEPIVTDEAKGVAPFMMAYSEVIRIQQ